MSPSRQVSYNKNNDEPVDVAESEIAPLPTLEQYPDTEKCINLKGDHCAPPLRQVFLNSNSVKEPVDKIAIEEMEHKNHSLTNEPQEEEDSEEQKTPEIQHMLTQEGNKRCTQEERFRWQEANEEKV